jgi:hypothetical protein
VWDGTKWAATYGGPLNWYIVESSDDTFTISATPPGDIKPPARLERPCPGCGRPNDVGVKRCWCCGGELKA